MFLAVPCAKPIAAANDESKLGFTLSSYVAQTGLEPIALIWDKHAPQHLVSIFYGDKERVV